MTARAQRRAHVLAGVVAGELKLSHRLTFETG